MMPKTAKKEKMPAPKKDKKCVTCDLPLGEEAEELEPTEDDVEF